VFAPVLYFGEEAIGRAKQLPLSSRLALTRPVGRDSSLKTKSWPRHTSVEMVRRRVSD
jgi:hypothetical protein